MLLKKKNHIYKSINMDSATILWTNFFLSFCICFILFHFHRHLSVSCLCSFESYVHPLVLCNPCIICWFNWQISSASIFAHTLAAICLKRHPFNFKVFNNQMKDRVGWLFDQFLLSTISQFICIQSFGSTFLTLFHIVLNIKTLPRWYRIISKWTDDNGAGGGLGFPIYMEIVISLKASAIQRCD